MALKSFDNFEITFKNAALACIPAKDGSIFPSVSSKKIRLSHSVCALITLKLLLKMLHRPLSQEKSRSLISSE